MPDHEARGRAVYDHTTDDPRPAGRRRRPAADWGVGEEIFDRLPSRRFAHSRGGVDDGRRTIVIGEPDEAAPEDEAEIDEFATREEALRAREEHEALWGGDEAFVGGEQLAGDEAFSLRAGHEGRALEEPLAGGARFAHGGQPGRRTVKIGGRPGEIGSSLDRPQRRRPPRTVQERLGPRPDRVAAWAFALGLVLILIAVATALAGV
jgi:hypothetical protein